MTQTNTISKRFAKLCQNLEFIYDAGEAKSIAKVVFEDALGINFQSLIRTGNDPMLPDNELIIASIEKELLTGKPVQYCIGFAWFGELKLKVNAAVLIPRPETESLVHLVKESIKDVSEPFILDIATGSGCIALLLKYLIPDSKVLGCDISNDALAIAKTNGQDHQLDVGWLEIDILSANRTQKIPDGLDVIVSNPPYIALSDKLQMHKNVVEFEPHLALFVNDQDPLIFYRKIIQIAMEKLKPKGQLFFEIHESFGNDVKSLCEENDFTTLIYNDINDKNRMIKAVKNK